MGRDQVLPGRQSGITSGYPQTLHLAFLHSIDRRRVAKAFAMTTVTSMESIIQGCASRLYAILDEFAAEQRRPFELEKWINLYAFDAISHMGGYGLPFLEYVVFSELHCHVEKGMSSGLEAMSKIS